MMRGMVLGGVAVIWGLAGCGVAPTDEPRAGDPDTGDTSDGRPIPGELPPLEYIPMKAVGEPKQVGTAPIVLTDVTAELGLRTEGATGLSFVDVDRDGWPDLSTVSDRGLTIFRNVGGTFVDATDEILFAQEAVRREATQVVFGDVDGDGDLDAYVASRSKQDRLLLGDGEGHLLEATEDRGIPEALSVQTVAFVDVDTDGDLDIYVSVGRRIDADTALAETPAGMQGAPNILLINDGAGFFTDGTAAFLAAAGAKSETFGALFADFDRDGDPDAFLTRDFEPDHYLENVGGAFSDAGATVISGDPTTLMGFAVGDVDGDGGLDIYATDTGSAFLYQWTGEGFENRFLDRIQGGDPTFNLTGWGCALVDLDQDGDQDVVSVASYQQKGQNGVNQPARLGGYVVLENKDGALVDITESAGLGGPLNGASLATADFDLDGDLDIAVTADAPVELGFGPSIQTVPRGLRLLRNDSARAAGNGFLQLDLQMPDGGNRWAVGAVVDVKAGDKRTSRVLTAGESFNAAHSFVLHFGMGKAARAAVDIAWPGGVVTHAHEVPAGYRRMTPFDGDCCFPGQTCAEDYAPCPLWHPLGDLCPGPDECDVCGLVCDRFDQCGGAPFDCRGECAQGQPSPDEVRCLAAAACEKLEACLFDGGRARRPERQGQPER